MTSARSSSARSGSSERESRFTSAGDEMSSSSLIPAMIAPVRDGPGIPGTLLRERRREVQAGEVLPRHVPDLARVRRKPDLLREYRRVGPCRLTRDQVDDVHVELAGLDTHTAAVHDRVAVADLVAGPAVLGRCAGLADA